MPAPPACRTHLDLSYCGVTAMPAAVSGLTALCSLRLARNPLPGGGLRHVCHLPALAALDVSNCLIVALPERLFALPPSLTSLDVSRNRHLAPDPLQRLVARLASLQRFCAGCCSVRLPAALADTLATLPALRFLEVHGNTLAAPQGGPPVWQPLLVAVVARRTAAPPPPALPATEEPPGLVDLEASISGFQADMQIDLAAEMGIEYGGYPPGW